MSSVTFDTSILTNYYAAKSALANLGSGGGGASTSGSTKTAPTAPWQRITESAAVSALTTSVLNGGRFIDASAAKLDAPATAASASDYRNLFALYQGLSALSGVAAQAAAKGVSAAQSASLQARFAAGLGEVQGFLAGKPFSALAFADAGVTAQATSTVGVAKEADAYTTAPLVSGAATQAVPGLDPDASFSVTAHKLGGDVTVAFDLSTMADTPRTLANVVTYLNGKLADAGLATRFNVKTTAGVPQTTTAGGRTVSLGTTSPTTYALNLVGSSLEPLSFAAPDPAPAVYLAQSSGLSTGKTPDAVQQLYKLDPNGASDPSTDRVFANTLPAGLGAVRATATGADGSVYLLADVTGPTPDGQAIQGKADVALVKYDSAGTLGYVRMVGAAQSASGFALTVSADGKQVAVAGTVMGDLDKGDAPGAGAASSFVQVFGANGDALWSQRSLATGEQPQGLAFAADGSLLVTGVTHTDLQVAGARDTYLRRYSATAQTAFDGTSLGYKVSIATAATPASPGGDQAAGVLALPNGSIATATVEHGHAILRLYAGPLVADAQPTATRDLGDLGGGALAGLALSDDGSVVVAGTSGSGALAAGTVTTGYSGGTQAFVAKVSADLQAASSDRTSYVAASGNATATGVAVANGQVYITGQVAGPAADGATAPSQAGYVLALDPDTGAVGWSESLKGADGQAAPVGVAVDPRGASALDALGLPTGAMDFTPSQLVATATSARAGDSFTLQTGAGAAVKVTLAADDTLATLATKISRAAGFAATVTTSTVNGRAQLQIAPARAGVSLTLQAGPDGSDLLTSLGVAEGVVQTASTAKTTKTSVAAQPYALNLGASLSVADATSATAAAARLRTALATVRKAYTDLITPPASATRSTTSTAASAYSQSRLANYQLALARLTASG